jgi:galactose mutarotase-like enzyme
MATGDGQVTAGDEAVLRSEALTATVAAKGAELVRLQDAQGRDLLWSGDEEVWGWHAPLLFPIVGRARNDQVKVAGRSFPMKQHGIARKSQFRSIEADAGHCLFRLSPDASTREAYPFEFRLDVLYELKGNELAITASVTNTGSGDLPASFGFHPAFVWPLPEGGAREDHVVRFDADEPAGIRQLNDGLLKPGTVPNPVRKRRLALTDELFSKDALVFDQPRSRRLVYGGRGGPQISVEFPDMPHLGIWSKPGAGFVCLEPWHGHASPEDFDGELRDKPGIVNVPEDGTARFAVRISVLDHQEDRV